MKNELDDILEVNTEGKEDIPEDTAATQQSKEVRQRFRIERVAFIAVTAIIAGVLGGAKTDLGPVGLMLMVALIMACFYGGAKTLLGIGGFSETVAADDSIPAFDWKRLVLDPLYFAGVFLAVLLIVGIGMLIKWAFSGRE